MALLQVAMIIGHNYTLAIPKWYHDFPRMLRYFSLLMFATLEFQETLTTKNGSVVFKACDKDLTWYHQQQRGVDHISLSTTMKKHADQREIQLTARS
jgi:hypothetical protein